uniref:Dead end transcript variant 2 n=1 Tax=Colossoma macropomum TaxID=42526 RepID=A0A223HHE0_9TELE|nr:dead end transcript variant 2 [Colossoma macropomum]
MEAELLQVLSPQSLRALEEWQRRESVILTQVNGQRRYGGPPPDFKKRFGVSISVRWMLGSSKSRQQEHHEEISLAPPGLKHPAKPSLPPPRFQITRPTHLRNYRDPVPPPLPPPPPPAAPPPPPPPTQGFSRAVGGPAPHVRNGMVPLITRRPDLMSHDSVVQLQWLCELHGLGVPLYDLRYHHTSPDGLLHFNYRVIIPRLPVPLSGAVQILPGISANTMEDEVHRAVAEQAIKVMCHKY